MLRALGRMAAPAALAVPLLAAGLFLGGGGFAPGGEGPTVRAVPHNGPLAVAKPRESVPEVDRRYGAHPVTFPAATGQVRQAVARESAPRPDLSDTALPAQVLAAYRAAAGALGRSDPGCRLGWPLLAGVGRVESGHAYGGAVDRRGDTLTPILGPVLDGGPGVAAIPDTDDGRWDTDKTWDRAVGPMQFIPGSWVIHGQDGNGDGQRDPNNVIDAALAAAYYLCGGSGDLTVEHDRRAAVFSYNHSWDYVDLVLAWADAYADGTPVLTGALPGSFGSDRGGSGARGGGKSKGGPARAWPGDPGAEVAVPVDGSAGPADVPLGPVVAAPDAPGSPASGGGSDGDGPASAAPTDGPREEGTSGPGAEPSSEPTKSAEPASEPTKAEPTSEPTKAEPTSEPTTAEPSPSPTPDKPSPTPSPDPCPTPTDSPSPTESPTPSPTQVDATPTPTPTDTCSPSGPA